MQRKVSIIVPVYNAQGRIRRCVESIVRNTYRNIEIILIDDCSTDQSWEICQKLERENQVVRSVKNDGNKGVSATRNRGLELMSGDLLMFVDSDDWVEINFIELFVKAFNKNETNLIVCGYINHDEVFNGRTDEFGWNDFLGEKTVNTDEIIVSLYESRLLQTIWNKIFCAADVRKYGITFDTQISIGEDLRFVLNYIEAAAIKRIALINQPLYHYMRDSDTSLMRQLENESIEEFLKNMKKIYCLAGVGAEKQKELLKLAYEKKINVYAYVITRKEKISKAEKKKKILQLDARKGRKLYWKHKWLLYKERVRAFLKSS